LLVGEQDIAVFLVNLRQPLQEIAKVNLGAANPTRDEVQSINSDAEAQR
jgi:hypothetical protein